MGKIKFVTITKEDEKALKEAYEKDKENQTITEEEYIEQSRNQTLVFMNIIKQQKQWKDAEDMYNFILAIKKIRKVNEAKKQTVELEDDEIKTVIKVMTDFIKEGEGIKGEITEKYVEIMETFKNA